MEFLLLTLAILNLTSVVLNTMFTQRVHEPNNCDTISRPDNRPAVCSESRGIPFHQLNDCVAPRNVNNEVRPGSRSTSVLPVRRQYSKHQLLEINNETEHSISNSLLSYINHIGIRKPCWCKLKKRRNRGTSSGRRRQRPIQIIISSLRTKEHVSPRTSILTSICTKNIVQDHSVHLKVLYLNTQSCRNKTTEINDLIMESNADLVFITKTWLKETGDEPHIKDMTPVGYNILSVPRQNGPGGGIAVIYRDSLKVATHPISLTPSFECLSIKVQSASSSFYCVCLYRPHRSKKRTQSVNSFSRA